MIRAIVSVSVAVVLSVSTLTLGASPASARDKLPPLMLGPGDAGVSNVGGQAILRNSKFGPVYISGKHSSHLRITHVEKHNRLRFRDTRTQSVKSMPGNCQKENVRKGISVVCRIPKTFADRRMFVQVWPRLGNDYVDGSTLGRRFRLWVLTDDGRDVVQGGDGADFVNGAMGNDRMLGGSGNDWLRGGPGGDRITAGAGKDRVSHH